MAKLDLEMAKRINEAFGPCTSLYECTDPEQMVKDAGWKGHTTVQEYVTHLVRMEDIFLDHEMEALSYREGFDHAKVKAEFEELMARIKTNLKGLGFEVP